MRRKYVSEAESILLSRALREETDTIRKQSSGNKKAEEDADKDTEEKLQEIKKIGGEKGDKVVEDLLKAVTDVKPEVPDRT